MIAEIYKEGEKRSQPKKFPFPKKKSQIQNLDFSWFSLAIFVLVERFLLCKQVILVSCQLVKTTGTNIFPYHFDNSLKNLISNQFFLCISFSSLLYHTFQHKPTSFSLSNQSDRVVLLYEVAY